MTFIPDVLPKPDHNPHDLPSVSIQEAGPGEEADTDDIPSLRERASLTDSEVAMPSDPPPSSQVLKRGYPLEIITTFFRIYYLLVISI